MAGLTNTQENAILDHIVRNQAYTPKTTWYVGLYTTLPADDGTGGVEVSGGSYARQSVTASSGFNAASAGLVDNAAAIDFGTATASWGTIVGFGLFDAVSAGTLHIFGSLTASKTVANGDGAKFLAGELNITLD